MYYTEPWITQIHGSHKSMIFCNHRTMNYINTWITQVHELHRYMNYTNT